jgi:hypothetical protein
VAIWHAVVGVGGREHDDGIAKPELGVRDGAVVSGLTSANEKPIASSQSIAAGASR